MSEYIIFHDLVGLGLGKTGKLVSTELLRDNFAWLLGSQQDRGTSLGNLNKVRAVEGSNELLLQSLGNTTGIGSLEDNGLGKRLGNLVGWGLD